MLKKVFLFSVMGLLSVAILSCATAPAEEMVIVETTETMPYAPEVAKAGMQDNLKAMMDMGAALEEGDYARLEANFQVLMESFTALKTMEQPTGDKELWLKTVDDMILLSKEGIAAAQAKDAEAIGMVLGKIQEVQAIGHDNFKNY